MLRFRLRTLLAATASSATYVSVGQNAGYPAATAVGLSVALVFWSARYLRWGWLLPLRLLALLVGACVLWIAGVDGRWLLDRCPDCDRDRDITELRVLGFTVWSDHVDRTGALGFALRDMGYRCSHPRNESWMASRYWGGVHCAFPCFRGTMRLDTSYSYSPFVAARVREAARTEPGLGSEIQRRCIRDQERNYFFDGLLIDWRTLAAYDEGRAREAHYWISTAPDSLRKQIEWGYCDEWSDYDYGTRDTTFSEYVDRLYETGVEEVIVIWRPADSPWSEPGEFWGRVVVRLPTDAEGRCRIIGRMNELASADWYEDAYTDYGQQFAHARALLHP